MPSLETDVAEVSGSSDEEDVPPPLPPPRTESLRRPAEEGEETALECNASRVIEYSDLCLGADPPPDCYPGVKVGRI